MRGLCTSSATAACLGLPSVSAFPVTGTRQNVPRSARIARAQTRLSRPEVRRTSGFGADRSFRTIARRAQVGALLEASSLSHAVARTVGWQSTARRTASSSRAMWVTARAGLATLHPNDARDALLCELAKPTSGWAHGHASTETRNPAGRTRLRAAPEGAAFKPRGTGRAERLLDGADNTLRSGFEHRALGSLSFEKLELATAKYRLRSTVYAQFAVNMGYVGLNRIDGHEQTAGDLPI